MMAFYAAVHVVNAYLWESRRQVEATAMQALGQPTLVW